MNNELHVLLAGRNSDELERISAIVGDLNWVRLSVKLISNGHCDPLHEITDLPDALVFCLGAIWEEELKALSERHSQARPPALVVGPDDNLHALRSAMRAGARDYLSQAVERDELVTALRKIAVEQSVERKDRSARVTAVVNAKGGSGASLLTCNLAHVTAAYGHMGTTLIDLDLQFGTLPLYLDIPEQRGMNDALKGAHELDELALRALAYSHPSGVQVLGAMTDEVVLPSEIDVRSVQRVLAVASRLSERIFIDLPRQIDAMTSYVFEQADQVLVVTQQSVTHLRQAKRLMSILLRDLSISSDHITVLVNRHNPKSLVTIKDVERSLGCRTLVTVPNDFRHVAESVNLGVPLFELAPRSSISKALVGIADGLSGKPKVTKGRFFRRTVSTFGMETN